MAKSKYNYDLPDGDGPKTLDQDPSGSVDSASAIGNVSADAAAPLQAPRGRAGAHRGPDGRLLKDGYGGYDVVSGMWCHSAKNFATMHHPDSDKPVPYNRPDYSQQPSISEALHRRQCAGGNACPAPAFHFGLQDGM